MENVVWSLESYDEIGQNINKGGAFLLQPVCVFIDLPIFRCVGTLLPRDHVNASSLAPLLILKAACRDIASMIFLIMVVNRARLALSWR